MPDIGDHAARDADAAADRHHRGRGRHQDPREVPARARERGVGPAARAHVRQDVPAHLRRLPGAGLASCSSRSTSSASSARATQDLLPFHPRRGAGAAGARGADRAGGDRRRPCSWRCSAALSRSGAAAATTTASRRQGADRHDDRDAAATTRRRRARRATRRRRARRRRGCGCGSSPTGLVYVCLSTPSGKVLIDRQNLAGRADDAGRSRASGFASPSATATRGCA